ncbi:MAG: response regulator transcription factor [Lachnospiraceae bacterium]|nr:response regulator transcription factor [Lachnospiraceae bacterium]MBP3610671.1 response regulator transcription factor [Lachnospiraceae bacterium]
MGRILIIEDDEDINHLLGRILKKAGYEVISAYSGTEAKLRLDQELPDLMLTDLMLPGMKGEELIRYLREEKGSSIPVIVLSAKAALEHKVELITMGADDYITKPFEPQEVLVRVMAVLRRTAAGGEKQQKEKAANAEETEHRYKKLSLNTVSRKVVVMGKELALTPHEYEILLVLLKQPDKVFSREVLYEMVWNNGYFGEDNTVNVHVSNIRKKIAAADPEEEYIKTVWGIGFKMV